MPKNDLIEREALMQMLGRCETDALFVGEQRLVAGRRSRKIGYGAQYMLDLIKSRAADPEQLPPADAACVRRYGYAKYEDHYRMVPCDEDITCMVCGNKRPRLRNENVMYCSSCGAVLGGLVED